MAAWQPILDFWYLPPGDPRHHKSRPEWFRKDAAFDLLIRQRFGAQIEQALVGGFLVWDSEPRGALARIILLDQFTRNAFRDTPRAFAGDPLALAAALALVGTGSDRRLTPVERWFVYLPLEHAEDMAMQERSVALFLALAAEPEMEGIVEYAVRHRDIIARFGRFPHRNRILGRASTPEEEEFLKLPGSGF
ncbi:MAG: DUF924 domain-containing protein [Betaproteobacteria bacterium]|nr:DUF924 domain-containing protein [Betaproteobacteria bacterium]MBK9608044.1 DUF924 domain-containing protein [Betaproteobacteria bacterium]